jgi:hypothetical protein
MNIVDPALKQLSEDEQAAAARLRRLTALHADPTILASARFLQREAATALADYKKLAADERMTRH